MEIQRYMMTELERAQQFALVQALKENLALYQRRQPCTTPWPPDDPIFAPTPGRMGISAELLEAPVAMEKRPAE